MSLTPQDIIARLDPINTLIETIFTQLLIGQTESLIEIKKRLVRWICASKVNDAIPDLNEEILQEFITYANKTILQHLDAAAHYYRLTWSSQSPTEATFDLEWVKKQWDDFVRQITPAINQIKSPKSRIRVTQLIDRDDLTQVKNPLLNFQLQLLKLFLQEAKEVHNDLTTRVHYFKKPPTTNISTSELISCLTRYQDETSKAQQIIRKITERINAHVSDMSDERLIQLGRSLCIAIQVLETCSSEREKIIQEIEEIYPQTDDEQTLLDMQLFALNTLKNKIKTLLLVFIQINVEKNNVEMQFFRKSLLEFVNSLCEALTIGKRPIGDADTVKILKKALRHHLGESTDFFSFDSPKNYTISLEKLLNDLFESSDDEKPSLLDGFISKLKKEAPESIATLMKEKIAQIRYTLKKMDEFPIDKIAADFLIYEKIAQQRINIETNSVIIKEQLGQLQLKITEFLKKIASLAAPIPTKGFDTNLPCDANDRSNQLRTLQANLTQLQTCFENNAKVEQPLIEIKSSEQLIQLQKATEVIFNQQKLIKMEIQTLENDMQEDEVNTLLRNLNSFYQNKKKEFQTELNQEINDTQAALLFKANQQKPTTAITETIREHHEVTIAIETRQDSLTLIFDEVKQHVAELKKITKCVKDTILKEITPTQEALSNSIYKVNLKKEIIENLNENNPFRYDLIEADHQCQLRFNKYNDHVKQLSNTKGTDLLEWSKNYHEYQNNVVTQLKTYETLIESSIEIENRLKTKCYKKSNELLAKLQLEYVRIFNKYIDSKRTKKLTPEQITELKQNRDSLIYTTESMNELTSIELKKINLVLDSIDPRLRKLISIYSDFKETNERYISKNPNNPILPFPLSDKTYCNTLIEKVMTHLRNSDMEALSDRVNSQFFQWIRRHILRPLEHLVHKKSAHFFTIGACATEKTLVELGNNYYQQLTP